MAGIMRITKEMVDKVRGMPHGEQILQHYNLYVSYRNKDNTLSSQHKQQFLIMGGFITTGASKVGRGGGSNDQ